MGEAIGNAAKAILWELESLKENYSQHVLEYSVG